MLCINLQETTLILQLLYQNEFKYNFLNHFREKYEEMVILAIENQAYMKNYKHLDSNLDRGMRFTPLLLHEADGYCVLQRPCIYS